MIKVGLPRMRLAIGLALLTMTAGMAPAMAQDAPATPVVSETAVSTETQVATDVPEATEEDGVSAAGIDPGTGNLGADYVNFSFPAGATIADLTTLSASISNIAPGTCTGGTPRFSIGVDTSGDGVADGYVFVTLRQAADMNDAGCGTGFNTGDMLASGSGLWTTDNFPGGVALTDWASASALLGTAPITVFFFINEQGSLNPDSLAVAFNDTPTPAFSTVTLNKIWEGTTPIGDACFTLTETTTEVVYGPICLGDVVATDVGSSVHFPKVVAGTYAITETSLPDGYHMVAQDPVTVRDGYDEVFDVVNSDAVIPTETPIVTETPVVTETAVAPTAPAKDVTPEATKSATGVSSLPNTGQGVASTDGNTSMLLLFAAVGTAIAGAGALMLRNKRA